MRPSRFFKFLHEHVYLRTIYRMLSLLELKPNVLIQSYHGDSVDAGLVFLMMKLSNQKNFTSKFVANRELSQIDDSMTLKMKSLPYVYHLATSSLIVSNIDLPSFFRKRNGQKYVQVWHGVPIKKLAADRIGELSNKRYKKLMKLESEMWDLLLTSGSYESNCLKSAFQYNGDALTIPPLRHFYFEEAFGKNNSFNYKSETKMIVYAPSWREGRAETFVEHKPLETAIALAKHYSDYEVIFRVHHNFEGATLDCNNFPPNLTIQDGADFDYAWISRASLLITDYSSVVFDFLWSGQPFAFFVPDREAYVSSPGVYLDSLLTCPSVTATHLDKLIEVTEVLLNNPSETQKSDMNKVSSLVELNPDDTEWSDISEYFTNLLSKSDAGTIFEGRLRERAAFHPILHLLLIVVGGLSQLFYVSQLNRTLNTREFVIAILIMTFPLITSFMDFGAFNRATYAFSDSSRSQINNSQRVGVLKYTLKVGIATALVGVALCVSQITFSFGIFLIISGLSLFGFLTTVASRAQGVLYSSLVFANIQWPISLCILVLLGQYLPNDGIALGIMPTFINLIILNFHCLFWIRNSENRELTLRALKALMKKAEINLQKLNKSNFTYFAVSIPFPVMLQLDKYIYSLFLADDTLGEYYFYSLIFSGISAVLAMSYSIGISNEIKNAGERKDLIPYPTLRIMGLVLSSIYFIFTPFVLVFGFKVNSLNWVLLSLFSLTIYILGHLLQNSLRISSAEKISLRAKLLFIQLLVWLVFTLLTVRNLGIYSAVLGLLVSSLIHNKMISRNVKEKHSLSREETKQ